MTSEPGHDAAMIRRLLWLWLLACGCSAGPARPGAPVGAAGPSRTVRPGDIAIADVSVVPMSTDGVLAHRTVVIRGDRIVAVAPSAEVALDDEIEVIDGAGRWLCPADRHARAHVGRGRADDVRRCRLDHGAQHVGRPAAPDMALADRPTSPWKREN
jgi:hypothetical protein